VTTNQNLNSSSEGLSNSDEEEMKKIAQWYNETVGTGEVLLDIQDDLKELGIEK
jgi:hypothetical protein